MSDTNRPAMRDWRLPGSTSVLGVMVVLALIAAGVARHPASIDASGKGLFWTDIALLAMYGIAAIWVWRQSRTDVRATIGVGEIAGSLLGAVFVANHLIEWFVPVRGFALVIVPVFLMFAAPAAAGSAAWERTRSLALSAVAGVWCAIVGILILVCFAFALNLAFESRAESQLKEAFAASGTEDAGAFLVRNSLEAASEGLVRMPVGALLLSFVGALANLWISGRSRVAALAFGLSGVLMFAMGAASLWHAETLQRSARPPFVLTGVLLVGVALSIAHPVWSRLWRKREGD